MGSSTAGSTPLAPAVGAATMRPMQALHSPTFRAVAMISVSTGPASETARVSTFRASPPVRLQAERRAGS